MSGSRRVAITGLGAVCAVGRNAAETWSSLSEGRSGIGPIASIDITGLRFRNGAEARCFDPAEHFDRVKLDFLDRFAQFAVVAAREALADSGLRLTPEIAERTAEYEARFLSPFVAAERGYIDEVIMPHSTRKRLSRVLAMLRNKKLENPWKKHDNIPL